MPDGKESAIVPYNSSQGKIATFIPMIGGQVKLAYNATPGLTLRVRLVYAGDEWEYAEGVYPVCKHIPSPTATDVTKTSLLDMLWQTCHVPWCRCTR